MKVYTVSGTHRIDYDFSIEIFKFGCFVDSNKALKRAKAAFIKARDNDFADEIEEYSNEEEYPDIGEGALNIEMDEENGLNQGRVQYACYRQRALQWHDINYLCDCIREKGVRPNIDADYYWSFPEEFLENVPRDVIVSNWFYNNLYFDAARPKLTDPRSTKRLESFKELTEAGYDLWLQGGSNESTFNFEHNVRYATENAVLDKIVGMAITGCWSPVNDSSKYYYFDAIYQASYTRKQFFGGI